MRSEGTDKDSAHGSIAEILRQKDRLDEILRRNFKKDVTILFTDICGYTRYMETMGDIRGRSMLQKHNDILFPLVAQFGGVVVKTIGDAIMATFGKPLDAVHAAVAMQEALAAHNAAAEPTDRIYVKIGVNAGPALMDEADVFGDAVNVAARIQSKAGKEEILVSENLYNEICGCDDILCRLHGTAELKGKAEPLKLYRVVWRAESAVQLTPVVRSAAAAVLEIAERPQQVFQLDVALEKSTLKISAYNRNVGEATTVQHYEEKTVSMEKVNERCGEVVELLNRANREGRLHRETLMKLRSSGRVFCDDLFTAAVKERLAASDAAHLVVTLDDQLVQVPWELLHDGRWFLCQRFSMGRLVRTRQHIPGCDKARELARPLKMMVLADPTGDLKGAYEEGLQVLEYVNRFKDGVNASLRSENISSEYIREKIRNFDIVHFAGHADYDPRNPEDSGWRLSRGRFSSREIMQMSGAAALPALIFSNACQSARTDEWDIRPYYHEKIFGLANAFVLAGVKHYIGTFWEILDAPGSLFALTFYENLFAGRAVGEALRQARTALIQEYGEETIVWGSYLLYGDPTFRYTARLQGDQSGAAPSPESRTPVLSESGRVEAAAQTGDPADKRKMHWRWSAAAAVLLIAGLVWGYPGWLREGSAKYERAARAHYESGDYDGALRICETLVRKNEDLCIAHLIKGHIALRQGRLEAAAEAYQKALAASAATERQRAEALMGLGRAASLRHDTARAEEYYDRAARIDPGSSAGYLARAMVLEKQGKYSEAASLMRRAHALAPEDGVVAAMAEEIEQEAGLKKDADRQARVDRLVQEILAGMSSPAPESGGDAWTSRPLTLWLMDFKTEGFCLQEGAPRLLAAGITDRLLTHGRLQVVERALLDKLLAELKLSTTRLVDRSTALALGRMLAARLILSGELIYAGPQTQTALRLIETETGRIAASISQVFDSTESAAGRARTLSQRVLAEIDRQFPLRCRVRKVTDREVVLNAGVRIGLAAGQHFKDAGGVVELEVISAGRDESLARIIDGSPQDAFEGMRLEAM